MARSPSLVMRATIERPASTWRQLSPTWSRGALISLSRLFLIKLRNIALPAAAGRVLGAQASPISCCAAALQVIPGGLVEVPDIPLVAGAALIMLGASFPAIQDRLELLVVVGAAGRSARACAAERLGAQLCHQTPPDLHRD